MGTFVVITIAILVFVAGFRAIGCETISFTRDVLTCYDDSAGRLDGGRTGVGLLALGGLLALVTLGRRSRP